MRAAVLAQLIVADPDGGYEFRHALVREAVHDDLLPGEHARLHARYAAAIEAAPDLVAAGRAPAEIAHHWHAANERPKALTAALQAAEHAGQRYAYAEQSGLLNRVLELWEQLPNPTELSGLRHLDVLERALWAAVEAGDYMRAMKLTKAALAEVDREAEPLRTARLLERRGRLFQTFGKSDGVEQFREAYDLAARVQDPWERAALLADLGAALALSDRPAGARMAQEAGELAESLGDTALQVYTALTTGRVYGRSLPVEQGLADMRKAVEMAADAGDIAGSARALVNLSDLLCEVGRYAESAEVAERGLADATRVGIRRSKGAFLLANLAEALVALGRWDEADIRAAETARLDPVGAHALLWLIPQAVVRLARGQTGAAELLGRALHYLTWPYLVASSRLPLHTLRIDAALAGIALAGEPLEAASAALADPVLPGEPRYAWPVLAAAARVPGGDDLTARIRTAAAALPAVHPAEFAYAAQVAAALTEGAAALPAWQAAVAAWRLDGQPYQLARALTSLAEAAAGAGDRATAADAIAEAGAIAATLDAVPLRDELATLARRLGLRAAAYPANAPDLLTSREQEVLRLVAEGRSNRRIAEELYISPKTASVHVSRIIAKLDVTNRVEAAAVARRLGLLSDAQG
jgi:DNA-binding CsgD family transcriptional regulator